MPDLKVLIDKKNDIFEIKKNGISIKYESIKVGRRFIDSFNMLEKEFDKYEDKYTLDYKLTLSTDNKTTTCLDSDILYALQEYLSFVIEEDFSQCSYQEYDESTDEDCYTFETNDVFCVDLCSLKVRYLGPTISKIVLSIWTGNTKHINIPNIILSKKELIYLRDCLDSFLTFVNYKAYQKSLNLFNSLKRNKKILNDSVFIERYNGSLIDVYGLRDELSCKVIKDGVVLNYEKLEVTHINKDENTIDFYDAIEHKTITLSLEDILTIRNRDRIQFDFDSYGYGVNDKDGVSFEEAIIGIIVSYLSSRYIKRSSLLEKEFKYMPMKLLRRKYGCWILTSKVNLNTLDDYIGNSNEDIDIDKFKEKLFKSLRDFVS